MSLEGTLCQLVADYDLVDRANRSNQRQTRALAWLGTGLPKPGPLHREIPARGRRIQTTTTPSIGMSLERTYHRRRRQDGLGRLTPIEYEAIMTTAATQAA